MATQDYAASIQGVSIRVTRLDAAGNLLTGPLDSYTTSAFMRVSFTPEYEEGDEITEKGANGVICVSYKAPDTLKRITMELAICEPDPELSALLSGGLLLRKDISNDGNPSFKSVGWAAPGVGDDPAGNGVAIECWSHAVSGGKRAGVLPYFHWVFPYAKFRQSGDRVIENGMMANTFEGYGLGNVNFATGIDGRWEFPVAAERPYAYARTSYAPTGLSGFYTWSDNSTNQVVFSASGAGTKNKTTITIANVAASNTTNSNNITMGFSNNPVLSVGDLIRVQNIGTEFDGDVLVVSYAANTITYTSPVANTTFNTITTNTAVVTNSIARVQVLNAATEVRVSPVATTETDFASAAADSTFNVPGSRTYNADNAIDNIITANETGSTTAN
jgi:hypothetical protein